MVSWGSIGKIFRVFHLKAQFINGRRGWLKLQTSNTWEITLLCVHCTVQCTIWYRHDKARKNPFIFRHYKTNHTQNEIGQNNMEKMSKHINSIESV